MTNALYRMLLVSLSLTSGVHAQLRWETLEQDFKPGIDKGEVVAEFPFTNVGDKPVTITKLEPSCECTKALLAKREYQPGEEGKVLVTFTFGYRQGLHAQTVKVETDPPADKPAVLILRAEIPELVKLSPLFTYWNRGKEAKTWTVKMKVLHGMPIQLKRVKPSSEKLVARFRTIEEGREYEISVTPTDTKEKLKGSVILETDFPFEGRSRFRIHAHIL